MMKAQHELASVFSATQNSEAQQRRLLPVELALLFNFQRRRDRAFLLTRIQVTQVFLFERDRYAQMDQLQWLTIGPQIARGPEGGMAHSQLSNRLLQFVSIERNLQVKTVQIVENS